MDAKFTTNVRASTSGALDTTSAYEIARFSIPLPTVMPSYNQIGFDSLRYLLGTVESDGHTGLAWMVGAKLPPGGTASVVDPTSRAVFPFTVTSSGDLATLIAAMSLEVNMA